MIQAEPQHRDERGFVAVWFAVVLFVLLGIAALAVDVVHGYAEQQDAQNAADAAALAGVVFLPNNYAAAQNRALIVAKDNGFNGADDSVTVTQGSTPTKLKVEVRRTVKTYFGGIFGIRTISVRKSATADYDQPVRMGSPANTFGNQPDCASSCTNSSTVANPHFWFNIAGKESRKQNGDAYQAGRCDATADNCPSGGTNTDYDPNGYSFRIHNDVAGATLDVEAFDAGLVEEGDTCTDNNAQLNALAALSGDATRYAVGPGGPFCAGDKHFDYGTSIPDVGPPTTTYSVYFDPGTPWNAGDDDPVCAPENGKGLSIAGVGRGADFAALWNANDPRIRTYFRRWASVCTITNAKKGDYVLYLRADAGRGHNRGSLRVKLNGSLTSTGVSMYAEDKMALYQNETANTQFYLARVVPGAAGRTLTLKFFDTGDSNVAGTIKVHPPTDAVITSGAGSTPLTNFSGCTYTAPTGNATGPPWGALTNTGSDCSVSGVQASAGWQGQWIEWNVPIPDNYSCTVNSAAGCWVTITFDYGAANPADTSTWQASLDGNPVRLVD